MRKMGFLLPLVFAALFIVGCGKVRLGDAAALPGLGETFSEPAENDPAPKFKNGDLVRFRMPTHKDQRGEGVHTRGIVMQCDYKYIVRIDFSQFDNYERRYVYEFELQKEAAIPARWAWMAKLTN